MRDFSIKCGQDPYFLSKKKEWEVSVVRMKDERSDPVRYAFHEIRSECLF